MIKEEWFEFGKDMPVYSDDLSNKIIEKLGEIAVDFFKIRKNIFISAAVFCLQMLYIIKCKQD